MGVDAARQELFGNTANLIKARVHNYGQGVDRWGLVHCDIRLANLLI